MIILRVEHKIENFEKWKELFDSDPINREQSGVQNYDIFKLVDNPNYVIIELEFEDQETAKKALAALNKVWAGIKEFKINPKTQIMERVESANLNS